MNTEILDFSDYDEQSQIEMQKLKVLNFREFQNEKSSNNAFQNLKRSTSFAEIRNEIALESPRGKKSLFYKSTYITKNIDFVKIAEYLKLNSDFDYNYEKFIGKETFIFTTIIPVNISIPVKYNSENPLIQNTFSGEKILELKGKLYNETGIVNSKSDFIEDAIGGLELKFDYNKREVEYLVHYYFVGKKRVYEKDNNDNIAFTISSSNFDDFNTFLKIVLRQPTKGFLEQISTAFVDAIKKVSDQKDMIPIQKNYDERKTLNTKKLDTLDWLYQNIPDFAAAQLDFDQTIQNVFKLSTYDKGSIITDTTKSITTVLSRLDPKKVYNYFLSNPQQLINLLSGFDNDELVQSFCNYLTALTLILVNPDETRARKFNQSDDTHIETNILYGDEEGKVELRNELQLPSIGFNAASLINLFTKDIEINNPNKQSNQFHPLELIYLTHYDEELKEEIAIPTIALYAKYLGDQSEWSEVMQVSLAVFDVLSFIFSGGALSAGVKGAARLFAIIDISVSTINLALLSTALQNKLNKTEAGRWFVNHWGIISFCVSFGTISYYLAKGVIKYNKQLKQQLQNEPQLRKQIDELVEESQKVAEESLLSRGRSVGQILDDVAISKIKSFLSKNKVELQIGKEKGIFEVEGYFYISGKTVIMEPKNAAMFITDGLKMKMVLRENATVLEFLHEFMHFNHCKSLGIKNYYNLKGVDGLIARERHVFDKLMEHRQYLNRKELVDAKGYMNKYYKDFGITNNTGNPISVDFDFNISQIPKKRQEVNIDKLLNLK